MIKVRKVAALSLAALAMTIVPMGDGVIGRLVGSTAAFAGGNSGNHGNSSGDHGNSGNTNSAGANSNSSTAGGAANSANGASHSNSGSANSSNGSFASLAGFGNAAHASVQGLLHASPNSSVGRLKTYADLEFLVNSGTLQAAVATDQTALDKANTAYLAAKNTYDQLFAQDHGLTLSPTQQAALDSAQTALTSAQASLTAAQQNLAGAQQALADAIANANSALALATRNPDNPAVKSYVDGLLSKYYAYLATL